MKEKAELTIEVSITWNQWNGIAFLPWGYCPLSIDKMSPCAIHRLGIRRIYEVLCQYHSKRSRRDKGLIFEHATII